MSGDPSQQPCVFVMDDARQRRLSFFGRFGRGKDPAGQRRVRRSRIEPRVPDIQWMPDVFVEQPVQPVLSEGLEDPSCQDVPEIAILRAGSGGIREGVGEDGLQE